MKAKWFDGAALALVFTMGLTACGGDARFKKVTVGMGRDSVMAVSKDAQADSSASYLTGGKLWEVQFFLKPDTYKTDSTNWRESTPVVFADDKVAGVGWSYWEKQATALKIPLPPK